MVKPLMDNPPELKKKENGRVTMTRQYELITPLFGGGVKANEVDVENPIRGTAVRGHLRFWWRATRGGQFGGSLKEMKKAEDGIWGSAAKDNKDKDKKRPLPAQIAIRVNNFGTPIKPFVHNYTQKGKLKPFENKDSNVPAYAAFPLQRSDDDIKDGKQPYTVQKGIIFTLEVNFPNDYREDVEMALWAWEIFGGIGARTRRGFGTIRCIAIKENGEPKLLPSIPCNVSAEKAIKDKLKQITGEWPKYVPHLSPNMFLKVIDPHGNSDDAWDELIAALRAFRQSREGKPQGPTHWPEANAVRTAAGKPVSSKSPDIGAKFPRAQLGLPILFHFPQERGLKDATLTGKTKERMASRLILRPLACNRERAVGLAAVLVGPMIPKGGIALDGKTTIDGEKVTHKLTKIDAKTIIPLNGETSLVEAFFEYLKQLEESK